MSISAWWCFALCVAGADVEELKGAEEGFADSGGVKIHYVTMGQGPLVVMIHGFPDFWYTWRDQMPALAKQFQVVAIDLRGFNKSDQPRASNTTQWTSLLGTSRRYSTISGATRR